MAKSKRDRLIKGAESPTAKAPAPITTARPDLGEIRRRVDDAIEAATARQPGSVVNKQRDTDSARNPDGSVPYFAYYTLDPVEMKAGRVHKERDRLTEAGYWLADGTEYVPEVSTAEIWMTYADVQRAAFARRLQRVEDNRNEARLNRLVH